MYFIYHLNYSTYVFLSICFFTIRRILQPPQSRPDILMDILRPTRADPDDDLDIRAYENMVSYSTSKNVYLLFV